MRQFYTAVVERKETVSEGFTTHPYEAAWASEAIFFVRIEEAGASVERGGADFGGRGALGG